MKSNEAKVIIIENEQLDLRQPFEIVPQGLDDELEEEEYFEEDSSDASLPVQSETKSDIKKQISIAQADDAIDWADV